MNVCIAACCRLFPFMVGSRRTVKEINVEAETKRKQAVQDYISHPSIFFPVVCCVSIQFCRDKLVN